MSKLTVESSVRKEVDPVGFALKVDESILGLDALSVNDKTLWISKINEAISSFALNEKQFLSTQHTGGFLK